VCSGVSVANTTLRGVATLYARNGFASNTESENGDGTNARLDLTWLQPIFPKVIKVHKQS
jgi:hypothetical protein